jgi:Type I phosphodiesterase / nucleotide pyrophosphatase
VPERPPDGLVVPDYDGPCLTGLIPSLLGPGGTQDLPAWFPAPVHGARAVVLFVVDGLGWNQLLSRRHLAPTLAAMPGGPIHAVAPTTTATSLTSIATGLTPAEHGIVGYRVAVHGEILNVLRWTTPAGDARARIDPHDFQHHRAFLGEKIPVVGRREFEGSGFTRAHLDGCRIVGYRMPSSIPVEVRRLLQEGERFVYAYYDGVDKVAHEYGFGPHYDAEVAMADRLVADVLAVAPSGVAVVVTADHGQVQVGAAILEPQPHRRGTGRHGGRHGGVRRCRPGGDGRPGARRALARSADHGRGPHPPRRRGDRGARAGQLPRPCRHGSGRAGLPPRLAHGRRDTRAAPCHQNGVDLGRTRIAMARGVRR